MTSQKRLAILVGIMIAMLVVAATWSVGWMRDRRRDALATARDLADCRRLRDQIASLRTQPKVAATEAIAGQELGERIAEAARKADLPQGPPRDVFPEAAQPVGDSPYLVKPTRLTVRGATLPQLATFLYHLADDSGLEVRELRLSRPHGQDTGKTWHAAATVTDLIYEPPPGAGAR